MQFVKWPHIENLQMAKELDSRDYQIANTLKGVQWIVTEKIDGTNICISLDNEGNFKTGKRTAFVEVEDNFYNLYANLYKLDDLRKAMYEQGLPEDTVQINLHGEYFGRKVLDRIHYGIEMQFRFFAMSRVTVDGEVIFYTVQEFINYLGSLGMSKLFVPIIDIRPSFMFVGAVPNDGESSLAPGCTMEGVVIMPFNYPPVSKNGNFMFKNKSDYFLETSKTKKQPRSLEDLEHRHAINRAHDEFLAYLTENRMTNVATHIGKPESMDDAGKFIGALLSDAKEEFLHDHQIYESLFSKSELKKITNGQSTPILLFRKMLASSNS